MSAPKAWSGEPQTIIANSLPVNVRSPFRALSYGPRQGHDALHLLFLRQPGGVDQHRVLRLHGLRGVLRVTMHESLRLLRDLVVRWATVHALNETPPSALPRIGDEKDLEVRVGKDHGADVTAVHDDVVLRRCETHLRIHPVAHAGHARDARHESGDVRAAKLRFHTLAVDQRRE